MWHVWATREVHRIFWWGDLRKGDHLGRPRRKWHYGIKINLREVRLGVMGRIDLAEYRNRWRVLVYAVMNTMRGIS